MSIQHNSYKFNDNDSDEPDSSNNSNNSNSNSNNSNSNTNHKLEEFLNNVNNELIEPLLLLDTSNTYIFNRIDCLINSDDSINNRLGKIRLLLFICNYEYKYIESELLYTNDKFIYFISIEHNTVLVNDFIETFFDKLVEYDFEANTDTDTNINTNQKQFFPITDTFLIHHINIIIDTMII